MFEAELFVINETVKLLIMRPWLNTNMILVDYKLALEAIVNKDTPKNTLISPVGTKYTLKKHTQYNFAVASFHRGFKRNETVDSLNRGEYSKNPKRSFL